ncbi:MAG TPA: hypothetical protein VNV42_15385 [Solirubrobacteraceae bacterium]|nr:hypothetical protein [Solirubrobacteraceae bacterium]
MSHNSCSHRFEHSGARHLIPGVAVAVALAVSAPTSVATATVEGCHPGSEAVVTKVRGGEWYLSGGFSGSEHAYICSTAGGRTVEIGQPGNEQASSDGGLGPLVRHLVFAGLTAAVAYENETGSRGLDVVDLSSGRVRLHRGLGGGKVTQPGEHSNVGSHAVGAIVVKPDGSVAWTEQARGEHYDVLKHEGRRTVVLDRTGQTRPKSLTLTGARLRWVESDGRRRTAVLH